MGLRFLIDENLRGTLVTVLQRHGLRLGLEVDVVQIGDTGVLPRGTLDPQILSWIQHENRLLVSRDRGTLPQHLEEHLAAGGTVPGILILKDRSIAELADFLLLVAFASDPAEWANRLMYIPL